MHDRTRYFIFDPWMLVAALSLLLVGLLMVASSSMVISDHLFGKPFHFVLRQTIFLGLGLGLAVIVMCCQMAAWEKWSQCLLLLGLLLLVLVLVPGLGLQINGSRRWLSMVVFNAQVSELMKLFLVLYLSSYFVRHCESVKYDTVGFIKPLGLLAVIACLLLLEPDFGATCVITGTVIGMLFLCGVSLWRFLPLLIVVLSTFALLVIAAPYRLARLVAFLHPWANQFDSGYQLTQSLMAFGRGGIWGVGLGNGVQKLFYLPEAYTDFLFAVIGEELGLIGQLVVCGLFIVIIARAFYIGYRAYQLQLYFSAHTAYGLGLCLGLQVIVNLGVNMGLLPTKGLTLPLMSYGGSSLLVSCVTIALLLRIYHEVMCQG